jgi:hypothetical protein
VTNVGFHRNLTAPRRCCHSASGFLTSIDPVSAHVRCSPKATVSHQMRHVSDPSVGRGPETTLYVGRAPKSPSPRMGRPERSSQAHLARGLPLSMRSQRRQSSHEIGGMPTPLVRRGPNGIVLTPLVGRAPKTPSQRMGRPERHRPRATSRRCSGACRRRCARQRQTPLRRHPILARAHREWDAPNGIVPGPRRAGAAGLAAADAFDRCEMAAHSSPSKSSSPKSGAAAGGSAALPGAGARSAWA